MQQLAVRTRILRDTIRILLDAPHNSGESLAENKLIDVLHDLLILIRDHHDPSLATPDTCASFVAQVLLFGLFFAHTRSTGSKLNPSERGQFISDFWHTNAFYDETKKLRPFRTISDLLKDSLTSENELAGWYQDTVSLLSHAEYMGTSPGPTDYHSLFEKFLEAYDNRTRFDRGAFYTPSVLTKWMAETTDSIVGRYYGGHIINLAEKVIDPCCGTGGFLEALIRISEPSDNLMPLFVGFEVLPAPYALSQYRLDSVIKGSAYENRVRILLTDTLSDQLLSSVSPILNGFNAELAEANSLSKIPLRIVIGNPPSSDHVASQAPRETIEEALEVFRPPKSLRTDRQNTQKALNNEAYRFLIWCAQRVIESGSGVLALVLPGSFGYIVSLKYARKWLLDNFDRVYVIVLDSDSRTGEKTNSIFKVRQGRLVVFGVLNPTQMTGENAEALKTIHFLDISSLSLAEKEEFLGVGENILDKFHPLSVDATNYRFMQAGTYDTESWGKSWPLRNAYGQKGFFISKCSAVKLAPTSLLFHTEKQRLIRRSKEVAVKNDDHFTYDYTSLKTNWWTGQAKPPPANKFTEKVREAIGIAADSPDTSIVPYTYRPFVNGYVLISDDIFSSLSSATGNGTRKRSEVRMAFEQGAIGIALSPAPLDLGVTLTRFVSFVWYLPDNDIAARGNAMIYCDRFPEERRGSNWDSKVKSNVNVDVEDLFTGDSPETQAIFYAYAVMNCPIYLSSFESVLYVSADPNSPPKVPIVRNPKIRMRIAELGHEAAMFERTNCPSTESESLVCEWPERIAEFRLKEDKIDYEKGSITLIGTNREEATITGIKIEVLTLRISGHAVILKWLRERHYSYLRRTFKQSDLIELKNLLTRIEGQNEVLDRVDKFLRDALENDDLIEPPTL
jgi:hypothetical protein